MTPFLIYHDFWSYHENWYIDQICWHQSAQHQKGFENVDDIPIWVSLSEMPMMDIRPV